MAELTQIMTAHLTGAKFSELHFKILADGKETGITRHKRTSGRPRYTITDDVFVKGDARFDVMATKGVGMREWLEQHIDGA